MGPLYTPFDEVLERSDVLSLHCPLTAGTRDLLSDAEFARMARRPLVINTARGGLIDEEALVRALESGRIAGAAVDAVSAEPPPPDHPFMRLTGRADFILTPHVGWASREARQEVADQVTASIEAFAAGQPRNIVACLLSMDAIERAGEGHPGTPLGATDVCTAPFTRHLKFNAADPLWFDRDRFVQSNGHGSMLIYSLLHPAG